MSHGMVGIMLAVSIFIGLLGLLAFLWGLRSGQFDDEKKMTQGILFDGVEELRDAAESEKKREAARGQGKTEVDKDGVAG